MEMGSLADWLMAAFAAATAWYAYQNGKTTEQLKWLIGSLESHSTVRLRLQAKREGVRVVAYDPTNSRFPGRIPHVGEEWPIDVVYLAIPRDLRKSVE
jgi:hypothetical protein